MSIPPNPSSDVLEPWQREVVGKVLQLRWPLRDHQDLRRVGEILRDFGNRLIVLSQSKEGQPGQEREWNALVRVKAERKVVPGRLQSNPRRKR